MLNGPPFLEFFGDSGDRAGISWPDENSRNPFTLGCGTDERRPNEERRNSGNAGITHETSAWNDS
jgi:hypothetical protein